MKRICLLLSVLLFLCCAACSAEGTNITPDPPPLATRTPDPSPVPTAEPSPADSAEPEDAPLPTPEAVEAGGIDLGSILSMHLHSGAYSVLSLPDSSDTLSLSLAKNALELCTGHDQSTEAALLEAAGFTLLLQRNYDKAETDVSHTCAYMVGSQETLYGGEMRTLLIVVIRGTSGGEWFSNFDFAPSHKETVQTAENFQAAAKDVLAGLSTLPELGENPLVLVCGHSRGAACANLLGILLNQKLGKENVFTYTFATPATIRRAPDTDCNNIFNFINPCDVVTMLPLSAWGFARAGTDILLTSGGDAADKLRADMDALCQLAPTITDYYEARHSLTGPGLSEDGVSTFEVMQGIAKELASSQLFSGGQPQVFSAAPSLDSDLQPFYLLLTGLTDNDGAGAMQLLMQHMPYTYQALLTAFSAKD